MAVAFARVSLWLWGGKDHQSTVSSGSSSKTSTPDLGLRGPDNVRRDVHPTISRRAKRKWTSREERRIDREYDVVLVPSDGGCMSGSESDDSDWSIGWMEPHAPDFDSGDETESSFAVLVPCYGRGRKETAEENADNRRLLGVVGDLMGGYSTDGKKYMEELMLSLQNN